MHGNQPVTIMLVEDDPGHARLIEKNIRRANVTNEIVVFEDGRKALDFILDRDDRAGTPHPGPVLMLLDLNLPVLDGFRVLEIVKSNSRTKRIPIVVLTSTDDQRDVSRCYELGCNMFMTKPIDYRLFSESIRTLGLFMSIVKLPDGA